MSEIKWLKIIKSQAVANQGNITSAAIYVGNSEEFGLIAEKVSGTVDVKVEYQVIASRENDATLVGKAPKENGLAWVTPEQVSTIIASLTTGSKADGVAPMVSTWIRIKVTGNAGNGADAVVSIYLANYSA